MRKFAIIYFCLLILSGCGGSGHIDADDSGEGATFKVNVKSPDMINDNSNNKTAKWQDTGLIIMRNFQADGKDQQSGISLKISDNWYPWGAVSGVNKVCTMTSCGDPSAANYSDCSSLDPTTPVVSRDFSNNGCYLSGGRGIYLLLATLKSDGNFYDPNATYNTAATPTAPQFSTIHIGNFLPDSDGNILINKFQSCIIDPNTFDTKCKTLDFNDAIGSKIYIKVLDSYYGDNTTAVSDNTINVIFQSGIYFPNFMTTAIGVFNGTIKNVTDNLRENLLNHINFLLRIVILLYFCVTAVGFMTGLIKMNQSEAFMRIFKLAIVVTLTTPSSVDFINNNFLNLYTTTANFLANKISYIVMSGDLSISPEKFDNLKQISDGTFGSAINYLVIYDELLNPILSTALHIKIISLVWTANIWLIPFIYVLLFIMIISILQALLLYILAYVQIAILTIMLPFFAIFLLFKGTADLFQEWLKYMINSALLIVIATLGMGIMLNITSKELLSLFEYSVSIKPLPFFHFLSWWQPDNMSDMQSHMNVSTYFIALFWAVLCKFLVGTLPKLADSLSGAQLSPTSHAFKDVVAGLGGLANRGGEMLTSQAKTLNNKYGLGRLVGGNIDNTKIGRGALDGFAAMRKHINPITIAEKFEKDLSSYSPTSDFLNLFSKKESLEKKSDLAREYLEMIQDKKTTLEDANKKAPVPNYTNRIKKLNDLEKETKTIHDEIRKRD